MDFLQAQEFAEKNKYAVIAGSEFQSRCISGRYHSPSYLPPLSKPGADVGEILAILASLRNLNLMLSYETVLEVVLQTVGGEKNFHFHTDDGHASGVLGCTFLSLAKMHFTEFGLTMDEIEFILTALERLKRKGANMTILHGGHSEKAVFEVESEKYALKNILMFKHEMVQAYVYHAAFDRKRRGFISGKLMSYFQGKIEKEKLKEIYEKISGLHFFKMLSFAASGLPVYRVEIDNSGKCAVSEKVESSVLSEYV